MAQKRYSATYSDASAANFHVGLACLHLFLVFISSSSSSRSSVIPGKLQAVLVLFEGPPSLKMKESSQRSFEVLKAYEEF